MKKYYQLLYFLLVNFFLVSTVNAQSRLKIFGEVRLENNTPAVGATIIAKRSLASSATNTEGQFDIAVLSDLDTIVITHIGFKPATKIVTASTKYPIRITLSPSVSELKEVIVSTGYQDLPKERATGSF